MAHVAKLDETTPATDVSAARLVLGYLILAAAVAGAVAFSISVGHGEDPPAAIAGVYRVAGTQCLGRSVELEQSGSFVDVSGGDASGKLRLDDGRLTGTIDCRGGGTAAADLRLTGEGDRRRLTGTIGSDRVSARYSQSLEETAAAAQPPKKRSGEETFGRLMLAIAAVILAARLVGAALARFHQPRVMGEVLAGILLGPTLLGAVWPEVKHYLFPPDIVPLLAAAAQIGLAFYLFLVGMELDPYMLRGAHPAGGVHLERERRRSRWRSGSSPRCRSTGCSRRTSTTCRSRSSWASRCRSRRSRCSRGSSSSAGCSSHPVGALAIAGAAIDDVTAWGLLALATAVAGGLELRRARRRRARGRSSPRG